MDNYITTSEAIKEILLFIDDSFIDNSMRSITDFETLVDAMKRRKPSYLELVFEYAYAFNLLFKEHDYDKLSNVLSNVLENGR